MVAAGVKGRCFAHGKQKQHSYSADSSDDKDGSENACGRLRPFNSIFGFNSLTISEGADVRAQAQDAAMQQCAGR